MTPSYGPKGGGVWKTHLKHLVKPDVFVIAVFNLLW